MQDRSEYWQTCAADGETPLQALAVIDGTEYSASSAPVIKRGLFPDAPSIGNCTAASLTISILTDDDIAKSAETVINARYVGDETSEWVKMGVFYVSKRSKDYASGLLTLTCYDAMLKANQSFFDDDENPTGVWPQAMSDTLGAIAEWMGVEIDERTVIHTGDAYMIPCPTGLTVLQVLGEIAAAHGGNFIITPQGKLRLVPLTSAADADDTVDVPAILGALSKSEAITISGITLADSSGNSYTAGDSTGYVLSVDSLPCASRDLCDALYTQLGGLVYQPYTITNAIYDPAAELGDGLTYMDQLSSVLCYEEVTLNISYRMNASAESAGELEDEYPYQSDTSSLKKLIAQVSASVEDAKSISAQTTYYLLSDQSAGITIDETSGWSTEPLTMTSTEKYLWSYTETVYTDGTSYTTTPCVIGVYGEDGTGITSTSITYQIGSNGTTAPTGNWSVTIPSVSQGDYLWTRTIWTYSDGTTETMYSISYTGTDGEDGTSVNILGTAYTSETTYSAGNLYTLYSDSGLTTAITGAEAGDAYLVSGYLFVYSETDNAFVCTGVIRGEDGTGITSIINYYLASSKSEGVTIATSGWTTSVQKVDATNKYLWNYEVTTLTDGNSDITAPAIIGMYSEDGVGIDSVTEYYAVSTSNTEAPATWHTKPQTMDVTNKYLWNYEITTYSDGSTHSTDPRVIGVYGDTGEPGADAVTYYTWVKYADDASGTNMSDDPEDKLYIGLAYNKTTKTESTNASDYTWSLFRGSDGVDGADGDSYYTWVKYADDENGTNMSDDPDGKFYIGLAYNKESATESTKASDYTWSLFRGSDGVDGITVSIESDSGYVLSGDSTSDITLTARLYCGSEDIDPDGEYGYTWYAKSDDSSAYTVIGTGKTITISSDTFESMLYVYFTADDGDTTETYYLTDADGNQLTDEDSNYLTYI